jgi:fructokinase
VSAVILVCGEALIDLFADAPSPGGSLPASAVAGGSPFSLAIGLARWGRPPATSAACPRMASAALWKRACATTGWTPPW